MRAIAGNEWQQTYGRAFRSVFRGTDPFDQPIAESAPHRALLYPVPYLLQRGQFDALRTAAQDVGDDELCVSITEEFDALDGSQAGHWIINYWEHSEYRDLGRVGVLENAIYSPRGIWGVLISHEDHAIVGAKEQRFIDVLKTHFPEFSAARDEFLAYWSDVKARREADVSWLPSLLQHVYGGE